MKRIAIILAALLLGVSAFGQGISVEAPNLVAADEQFNVTFSVEGDEAPSDFSWSAGRDFQLVWGPQKGTSTSISIINGKRSKSSQTTYTYVLLPRSSGTFTLAAATARLGDRQISSSPKKIEVVAAGASKPAAGQQGGGNAASQAQGTGTISSSDLFMRMSVSRTSAVIGETITATLKLYQRVNIAGFEDAKFPTFNGFWSQEQQAPTNIEFRRENVGGTIYNAAVLRSWTLIPQKSGDVVVDPAELVCLVNVRQARSGTGSIFDNFFPDDFVTVRKRLTTPAVTVHVSPLPAGAPASFGGGVGKFSMKAALTRDSLGTHDAASLKVTVSGTGNVALLEAPKVKFPPDFEVYDTKASDAARAKTFEFPFIPRSHGDFVIGPVEYSYYDVEAHKYVTLVSDAMPLKVSRSQGDAAAPAGGQLMPGVDRKDVKDLGSDIRFIETKVPRFSPKGSAFVLSPAFWAITLLILLLAAAVWFFFRRMESLREDVVGARNRGAVKMARKRLSEAESYLSKNLYSAFYESLHKALAGFISDKFNMDVSDMSKENISARLQQSGVGEGLAADFIGLLDACEYARYAPDAGHDAMNAHYDKAVGVVSLIDQTMKKKRKVPAGTAAALALLMLIPLSASAADDPDSLWTSGANAYSAGLWTEAGKAWMKIEGMGLASPELYCNIGDAFYKDRDIAHAILYYERALKADPSYGTARYNLEIARGQVQDKIEELPEFLLAGWMRSLGWKLSSDGWAVAFLLLLAAGLALLLVFLLGRSQAWRKTGFFAGIVLLLLSFAALAFSLWQRHEASSESGAIITRPVVTAKSSPGGGESKDLFILHEGTKVEILDTVGEWCNVEIADGRQGWLESYNLDKI